MATAGSCELELVSLLKVTDSSFNLTPEEEDARYGPFDEIREEAEREIEASNRGNIFLGPESELSVELFWDGWQAAYLSSKRENASKGVVTDFGNDESTQQRAVRKRKFGETLSDEERGEMYQEPVYDKEYVLAFLACSVLLEYNDWPALESVVGKIECYAVQENMFDCFAKFILSILDEEDLERMFYAHQLRVEYRKFYKKLISKDCFRDFAAGRLKNLQLRHLTESDIYDAYVVSLAFGWFRYLFVTGLPEKWKNTELIEKFKSRASQLIKEHRPLKGELKAQVLMELTCLKCYHVTDILILEAIHGLKLPELLERSVAGINVEDAEKLSKLLGDLADTMFVMTNSLSLMKSRQAGIAEHGVIRPMFDIFMCFEDEVVDVLKIANYERRMENERFITLAHILTGLGCSRVADCVPEISRLASVQSYSGLFTFTVYEESYVFACQLDERVGLEHFVFALIYFSLEDELLKLATTAPTSDFFQRLKDCRTCVVQGWRNVDVFTTILEKRCRAREYLKVKGSELVKKLAKDLKSGRVILPCDEDLRLPS